jgi:hypothetical protein
MPWEGTMDSIQKCFDDMHWKYGPEDVQALAALERRIAAAARARSLITYSDLVEGIHFNLQNVRSSPFTIDVRDWHELDRAIIGDFLGYISARSYSRAGFFASALVVLKDFGTPGDGFYRLLQELGLISDVQSPRGLALWVEHVKRAHAWFATHE